jgi:o-succinylbenzoate synthase
VISTIALDPYRLPLRRPWRSARDRMAERCGWLVRCEAGDLAGFGDCAPLPAAGTEEEATAWEWLCAWRDRAVGQRPEAALEDLEGEGTDAPAARYGAECALSDLLARIAGLPMARWLESAASLSVPVNIALGAVGEVTPSDIAAAAAGGCRVFKVKVGLDGVGAELARLRLLVCGLPSGGQFRLDANGAWTLAEAHRAVDMLNALPVEALEEPLRDPVPERLRGLQAEARFPLALDESRGLLGAWRDPALIPVRRLVLKPAAVGGLRRTLALAQAAGAAGYEVVLTSVIESAAGLWPTAHLAAAIGSPIPHGLATAGWLAEDLGEGPRPRAGRIQLPQVPGSGFRAG